MKISAGDPGVKCVIKRFGIDVSKDGLLEILLRPHVSLLCNGKRFDLSLVIGDVIQKLDVDPLDFASAGIRSGGYNSVWDDNTYHDQQIGQLREIIYNLHKLKTRTQKAAERKASANAAKRLSNEKAASDKLARELMLRSEEEKRILQQALREAAKAQAAPITSTAVQSEALKRAAEKMAANREEARRDREYKRILEEERKAEERAKRNAKLAAHGKLPMATADLLGLHSSSAAAKPEEKDLLNINGIRKKQIANDLASIFSGGSSRTRKHKSSNNRKVRKSSKSRKHTRK
uniref:Uncharacterized protein n=1 Tax=viral metagenome TaxID=1070528 RepID=A0A6C0ARE6_9ZZZZ